MKRKILAGIVACIALVTGLQAQQINHSEYFIDTDPGVGNGIPISITTPANSVSLVQNIPTTGLATGFHKLVVRIRDNNNVWSHSMAQQFYIFNQASATGPSANLNGFEYFIDTDPGTGNGTFVAVSPAAPSPSLVINVPTTGLSSGFHKLGVRTRNTENTWSHTIAQQFYVFAPVTGGGPSAQLNGAEYFIDVDPGVGNAEPISVGSPSNSLNLAVNIPATGLATGFHKLGVRYKDTNNQWSHSIAQQFYVFSVNTDNTQPAPPIVAAEYYINTDPGVGNGIAIPITPGNSINTIVDLQTASLNLSSPDNILFVRIKDQAGKWSHQIAQEFSICTPTSTPNFSAPELSCFNSQVTFTNTSTNVPAGATYSWDFNGDGNIDATGPGPHNYTFAAPGTYHPKLSINEAACTPSKTGTIEIGGSTAPAIQPSYSGPVCNGATLNLTASSGNSFEWFRNGVSLGLFTSSITVSVAGEYTVTISNAAGCSGTSDAYVVVIDSSPVPTITTDPSASVCYGESLTLTGSGPGATGYYWNFNGAGSASTTFQSQFYVSVAGGEYTVKVIATYSNGCSVQSLPETLTVKPPPNVNAGSDVTIDIGNSTTLNATGNATSWSWDPTTALTPANGIGSSVTASPATTTTYTVTGVLLGCEATDDVTVNVNTDIPVSFTGLNANYCVNDAAVQLVGIPAGGVFSGPGISGDQFNPGVAGSGNHDITYTKDGQSSSQSTNVAASVTPAFAAIAPICTGETAPLLPSISTNGITGTWSPATVSNTTSASYTFTPAVGQCATATSLFVTVNPGTVPTFAAVAPICTGSAAPALPTTSTNGITGAWSPATVSNTTTTTYSFFPTAGQCATATTLTVTILQPLVPTFTAIPPISPGSAAPVLPTTSLNGITGTWNPSIVNNTTTGTYTFTPVAGSCASSVSITVIVNVMPDLAVQNVNSVQTEIEPNEVVTVTWTIANVGSSQSFVNWTEKIYMQSSAGTNRTLLKQSVFANASVLMAGQTLARNDNVTIPAQLNIGDQGVFVVEVIPGANIQESPASTANNTGVEATPWAVAKLLSLQLSSNTIGEGTGSIIVTVSRTASLASALTVTVGITEAGHFSFPATAIIPAGQSGVSFTVTAPENALTEGTIQAALSISAAGFQTASQNITLTDNDNPSLSISGLPTHVGEGESIIFQVNTSLAPAADLQVYLTSNNQARFPLPSFVTILAGNTSVNVNVTTVQDLLPELDVTVNIAAGASGQNAANASVDVTDDDVHGLELVIQADTVSESSGFFATQVTLRRTSGSNPIAFTANLSSSIANALIIPGSVNLAQGENEKTFTIGVVDNGLVDGFRNVTLTASILVTSCGCSAPPTSAGFVTDAVTIADNDGPSLILSVTPLTLQEGQANAGTLRITRNTPVNLAISVSLSSSNTSEATLPATVTIPVGEAYVDVPVTTINDGNPDGNQQVYFEGSATGFSPGSVWVYVTDINKPDLVISAVSLTNTTIPALGVVNYNVSVTNSGYATAPTGVIVRGYLSVNGVVDPSDIQISENVIPGSIAQGQTTQVLNAVNVPNLPGQYKLLFQVNPTSVISELVFTNNTSDFVNITINPDYNATAFVNAPWFLKGNPVPVTGSAIRNNGTPAGNEDVEVYVITNGLRREIIATTDAAGNYTAQFVPLTNEAGHYEIGASFPGLMEVAFDDNFDILGVRINGGNIPQFQLTLNDSLQGTLNVENLTPTTLTDFTIAPVNLPAGAIIRFDTLPALLGNTAVTIGYKVKGTAVTAGADFAVAAMKAVSNEGNIQPFNAFYFCSSPQGLIVADITSINTTVSQSVGERLVEFRLTNNGGAPTGPISIALPAVGWISSVTSLTLSSINPGDTSVVVIKFLATADVPFNFPINGNLAISATNANSFYIPFTFQKVSESAGSVTIDVVNQFTYFTEGAPKVEGAHVKISNYFTNAVYAEGLTDATGVFTASGIPEGTHRISVDKEQHLPYNNTITINPGANVSETVFLNYQAITFNWNVVPTAVQDQYDITLTTQFETNIPIPVVTIEMPDTMPQLFGDEVFAFNATLTNHGLVTAKDVGFNLPTTDPEYEFITNYVPADMLALQSIQIPVIMRRRSLPLVQGLPGPSMASISEFLGMEFPVNPQATENLNCHDFAGVVYWYYCALSTGLWQQGGVLFTYSGRSCYTPPSCDFCLPPTIYVNPVFVYPPCFYCPPPPSGCLNCTTTPSYQIQEASCVQCINDLIGAAAGCIPGGGLVSGISCVLGNILSWDGIGGLLDCVPLPLPPGVDCARGIIGAGLTCAGTSTGSAPGPQPADGLNFAPAANPPLGAAYDQIFADLQASLDAYDARAAWAQEYFGDMTLSDALPDLAVLLQPFVSVLDPIPASEQAAILTAMAGYEIEPAAIQAFFVRWNTSVQAYSEGVMEPNATYPDIVNWTLVQGYSDAVTAGIVYAEARGYSSVLDMHEQTMADLNEILDNQGEAVCASVTVQLSQQLTMTREAFEGTLTIFNGHPTDQMDSLTVTIQITDEFGVPSNDLFQIETTDLINIGDVTGTGAIPSQQEGAVQYLFIPELGAAPTVPKLYRFGGTVRYWDPFAEAIVTLPLAPVPLTVNPSPNLMLHYFLERNILGDDALTPQVEPIVPAELAVMIENHGYGPAVNVIISSAQPEITENETGLAIDFSLIGSNLQGQPANLGVTDIIFGTIPGQQTRIGEWYFTSSLLGKFVSYEASVVHSNSYGNPELSLIEGVELHELTKSIKIYGADDDGINDFLVNDIFDTHDVPDIIYMSQGNSQTLEVFEAEAGNFSGPVTGPTFTNTLSVTPSESGWNFIKLDDAGNGQYEIVSVTRQDGQVIPLDNAWLTFVTLPISQQPVYENKFHFADNMESGATTYTIVWTPKNLNVLHIVSIDGAPEQVSGLQVTDLTVVFDKEVNPLSFTYEDLSLVYQGLPVTLDASVTITPIDSVTFNVDLSAFTLGNGFYLFTAQAANISDIYGINGETGTQVSWTQFISIPAVQAFQGIPEGNVASSFTTLDVLFNLPVDSNTVTPQRFSIYKNGVLQPGAVIIDSVSDDQRLYYLSGLELIITDDGDYELFVDVPNIESTDGIPGMQEQSVILTLDKSGPVIVSLTPSNTGGIDIQHITFVDIQFNEGVWGFNTASLELSRDGELLPLNIAQLSIIDFDSWVAGNFGMLTYPEGHYILKVDLSGFTDLIGNAGTGSQQVEWIVDRSATVEITNLAISADLGFSNNDALTSGSEFIVDFDLSADALQVTISQFDLSGEVVLTTIQDVDAGHVSLPVIFQAGGNTGLRVTATGAAGGFGSAEKSLFVDQDPLTATWLFASNQVFSDQISALSLEFSDRLLDDSGLIDAIEFKRNGVLLPADALGFLATDDTHYMINGLAATESLPGNYEIVIHTDQLNKYSSGLEGVTSALASWTVQSNNTAPAANAGTDFTITSEGIHSLDGSGSSDPDSDPVTYEWIAPPGITLTGANTAAPSFNVTQSDNGNTYAFLLIINDGTVVNTDIVMVTIDIEDTGISFGGLDENYCSTAEPVLLEGTPSGGTFSGTGVVGNTFNPFDAGAGMHVITYTLDGSSTSRSVTVMLPVAPQFTAIDAFCAGGFVPVLPNTSLNGIAGTWNEDAIDNTTSAVYTFTPNAGQCAVSATLSVIVNQIPSIAIETAPACSQDMSTYSFNVEVSVGSLISNIGVVANTSGTTWSVTDIPAGINAVLTAVNGNCQGSLTVNAPNCNCPSVNAPASGGNVSYCENGIIPELSASAASGETVDWYDQASGGSLLASGTLTFTPSAPGSYYAQARVLSSGCVSSIRKEIILTSNPAIVPAFAVVGPVCPGSEAPELPLISINGIEGTWNPLSIATMTTADYTFTPSAGQCAIETNITVTINPLPVVSAGADAFINEGESVILTATGADSYAWSPEESLNQSTGSSVTASPSSTTIYTVTGTDGNQCSSSDDVVVTVNPSSGVSFTGLEASYCVGDAPSTLTGIPAGGTFSGPGISGNSFDAAAAGTGMVTITYTVQSVGGILQSSQMTMVGSAGSSTFNEIICESGSVMYGGQTITTEGSHVIHVTTSSGCDSTITVNVSILPNSNSSFTEIVCQGDEVTYGGESYDADGVYTIHVQSLNGCDSTITLNLTVLTGETSIVQAHICEGESYTLPDGQEVNQQGEYTSEINNGNCSQTIVTQLAVNPIVTAEVNVGFGLGSDYTLPDGIVVTAPGDYTSTLTSSLGCDSTVITHLIIVSPPSGCFAMTNVSFFQGDTKDHNAVDPLRSDPFRALYAPEAIVNGIVNFVTLGFGGEITLEFAGPVANGAGNDIRIHEGSWGNKTCTNYPERAEVFASQNGCDFIYLGTVCTNGGDVDLGLFSWARYIRLRDVSNRTSGQFQGNSDGFDLNAVECLNGSGTMADDGLVAGSIQDVIHYAPGQRQNGSPVPPARRIVSNAAGMPGGAGVTFVSLGFNGELTGRFDFVIFNKAGFDLHVTESSYGNPACATYPESARFYGSQNGSDWTELGTLCQDGDLELGTLDWIQYIKIIDESDILSSHFGGTADAFDIDGVVTLGSCGTARLSGAFPDNLGVPEEDATLSVYPNPVSDRLQIDLTGLMKSSDGLIELYDASGRLISSAVSTVSATHWTHTLNVSQLSDGVYVLMLKTAGKTWYERIVK